jgi:hypothetical protein
MRILGPWKCLNLLAQNVFLIVTMASLTGTIFITWTIVKTKHGLALAERRLEERQKIVFDLKINQSETMWQLVETRRKLAFVQRQLETKKNTVLVLNRNYKNVASQLKHTTSKVFDCMRRENVLKNRRGHLCGLPKSYLIPGSTTDNHREDEWPLRCDVHFVINGTPPQNKHKVCRFGASADLPSGSIRIPRRIAQTGPPNPHSWQAPFTASFGSWQSRHPGWAYEFWNDTDNNNVSNPNYEPFVAIHFPWFLPTWRQLKSFVLRLDVARYMWLYVYGGVYADLDTAATRDMTPWLRGADVVLPALNVPHSELKGCWKHTRYLHTTKGRCGPHVGNWWMASIPRHPLWLEMLIYVMENAESLYNPRRISERGDWRRTILELTGPYALGRVVLSHLQKKPQNNIAFINHPFPFLNFRSAGSWLIPPPSAPIAM